MKRFIGILLVNILVFGFYSVDGFAKETASKPPYWPRHISWSSSSGTSWINAVGYTNLIQKYTGVSSSALGPTGGGIADLNNLKAKSTEMAWGGNPSVHDAWLGVGPFKKEGPQKWFRCLSIGYSAYWYIVATKKSGIKKFEDLKGRRWVDTMVGSDVTEQNRDGLLKIHGMTQGDYKSIIFTKHSELLPMMTEGRVDAVAFFGAIPQPHALEMANSMDITWVSLSPEAAAKISEAMPGYIPAIIPARTYKGQDRDVIVTEHKKIIIMHKDFHEEVVYEIMKALFDHPEEMEAIHPSGKDFARKPASPDVTVPYHNGVIRYYKEKGLWTSELEKLQKKLLMK